MFGGKKGHGKKAYAVKMFDSCFNAHDIVSEGIFETEDNLHPSNVYQEYYDEHYNTQTRFYFYYKYITHKKQW